MLVQVAEKRSSQSEVQDAEAVDRRDACTQCGRAGSCACLALGVLKELLVDLDAACPKTKALQHTYKGDAETVQRIGQVGEELEGVRVSLREFLH